MRLAEILRATYLTQLAEISGVCETLSRRAAVAAPTFIRFPLSGRTLGVRRKQPSLGDQQIRHPEKGEQLRRVLAQAAVANLLEAEDVLDDVKWMLDLGTHARLELLDLFNHSTQRRIGRRLALSRSQGDMPFNVAVALLDALITRAPKGVDFLPVQQSMRLRHVGRIARRGHQRMSDARVGIDANMRLHARSTTGCPSSSDAFRDRARRSGSWLRMARQ